MAPFLALAVVLVWVAAALIDWCPCGVPWAWRIGALGVVVAAWLIVHKPLRQIVEELHVDQARLLFRQQREWLEARFLKAMGTADPIERLRWEDANWHDEVIWARDNQTRRLLALVEIHFDSPSEEESTEPPTLHATALFEYRRGRWIADGKRLDATRPADAMVRHGRFEPVERPHRRV